MRRYAKSHNKYMKDQYTPDQASTYLQYLYVNNRYGWTMIQKLPTHGFAWDKKVDGFALEKLDKLMEKDRSGYILEVDLNYPKKLQKQQNELPFLAEKMKIGQVENLVPNLKDKMKHVVHIKNLIQALKSGLKLKKSTSGY